MEGGFFNDRDPAGTYRQVETEKPIHRRMAELHMQGYTNAEIGVQLGYTPISVSNILRLPFIRKYLMESVKRNVKDELTEFLDKELMPSLQTMVKIRDDETATPAARLEAANKIVERRLGKASQPVVNEKPIGELSAEELDAEVKAALAKVNAN